MHKGESKMKLLTDSNEDYLEAIYILNLKNGKVRSVDISKHLNVSKPGVNKAMNVLKENGLIDKDYYGDIYLTSKGESIAKKIYEKHTTIKEFLITLGIDEETAEIDCCKIEHVISERTFLAIKEFIKNK
jgi:DtxR family Mn-dependent transcriptional regulator